MSEFLRKMALDNHKEGKVRRAVRKVGEAYQRVTGRPKKPATMAEQPPIDYTKTPAYLKLKGQYDQLKADAARDAARAEESVRQLVGETQKYQKEAKRLHGELEREKGLVDYLKLENRGCRTIAQKLLHTVFGERPVFFVSSNGRVLYYGGKEVVKIAGNVRHVVGKIDLSNRKRQLIQAEDLHYNRAFYCIVRPYEDTGVYKITLKSKWGGRKEKSAPKESEPKDQDDPEKLKEDARALLESVFKSHPGLKEEVEKDLARDSKPADSSPTPNPSPAT